MRPVSLTPASSNVERAKDELVDIISRLLLAERDLLGEEVALEAADIETFQSLRIGSLCHAISQRDGEFVLKTALFARRNLGLRRAALFLTALGAEEPLCAPFLDEYATRIVLNLRDWVALIDLCAKLSSSRNHAINPVPAVLQKTLHSIFATFSEYTVQTYLCSDCFLASVDGGSHTRGKPDVGRPHDSPTRPLTLSQAVTMLSWENEPLSPAARLALRVDTSSIADLQDYSSTNTRFIAAAGVPFGCLLTQHSRALLGRDDCGDAHNLVLRRLTSLREVKQSGLMPLTFARALWASLATPTLTPPRVGSIPLHVDSRESESCTTTAEASEAYARALCKAVDLSAQLNIPPLCGASLIVVCLDAEGMRRRPSDAVGGGPGGAGTVLDAACVQAATLMRAAESCEVILQYGCLYHVFHRPDPHEDSTVGVLWSDTSSETATENDSNPPEDLNSIEEKRIGGDGDDDELGGSNCWGTVMGVARALSRAALRMVEDSTADATSSTMPPQSQNAHRQYHRSAHPFPFEFLDELIERRCPLRVMLLLTTDSPRHSTSDEPGAGSIPPRGDLSAYLARLRRHCCPELLFVRANLGGGEYTVHKPVSAPPPTSSLYSLDVLVNGSGEGLIRYITEHCSRDGDGGGISGLRKRIERVKDSLGSTLSFVDAGEQRQRSRTAPSKPSHSANPHRAHRGGRSRSPVRQSFAHVWEPNPAKPADHVGFPLIDTWVQKPPGVDELKDGVADPAAMAAATERLETAVRALAEERRELLAGGMKDESPVLLRDVYGNDSAWFARPGAAVAGEDGGGSQQSLGPPAAGVRESLVDLKRRQQLPAQGSEFLQRDPNSSSTSTEVKVFHPTSFITLSKVSDSSVTLRYALRASREAQRRQRLQRPRDFDKQPPSSPTDSHSATPTAVTAATSSLNGQNSPRDSRTSTPSGSPVQMAEGTAEGTERVFPTSPTTHLPLSRTRPTTRPVFRECRFFISSTFLDMNNERNALTLDVFPRVRRWAAERGIKVTLLEVDLRWGITEAATVENLSTSVCLNEVTRCAPFFIGMIGSRYGSCPSPLQVVADRDVSLDDYGWLRELSDADEGRISVTELEMRHGIYTARRRMHAALSMDSNGAAHVPPTVVFFCRDSEALLESLPADDAAKRRVYEPDTPFAAERIAKLKAFVASQSVPLVPYRATYTELNIAPGAGASASDAREQSKQGRFSFLGSEEAESPGCDGDEHGTARGGPDRNSQTTTSFLKPPPKFLTSQDVLLDMRDFTLKACLSLQQIILGVCPAPSESPTIGSADGTTSLRGPGVPFSSADPKCSSIRREGASTRVPEVVVGLPPPGRHQRAAMATTTTPAQNSTAASLHHLDELHEFVRGLCKVYSPPRHLIECLVRFARGNDDIDARVATAGRHRNNGVDDSSSLVARGGAMGGALDSAFPATLTSGMLSQEEQEDFLLLSVEALSEEEEKNVDASSSILVVCGGDGSGKSSALAAVADRFSRQQLRHPGQFPQLLYYAFQAVSDRSFRAFLLVLVTRLIDATRLDSAFSVKSTDTVSGLLQLLPQLYSAINQQHRQQQQQRQRHSMFSPEAADPSAVAVTVVLDGLDKSSEAEGVGRYVGWVLHQSAAPAVRFIVTAAPGAALLAPALRRRAASHTRVVAMPALRMEERAGLVRRHLESYGKRLQETLSLNELTELLRKPEAGHPSYLTTALMHLRLFSTFDTLRGDMRKLPGSIGGVLATFFSHLEGQFGRSVCREVLGLLYLTHPVDGIDEYNLYRLVSSVAATARLVTLLNDSCLRLCEGRVTVRSSFVLAAIADNYLPSITDRRRAYERLLAAELMLCPLSGVERNATLNNSGVGTRRDALTTIVESINRDRAFDTAGSCAASRGQPELLRLYLQRSTQPASLSAYQPCLFQPSRHSPRELLTTLRLSILAKRFDVCVSLAGYLPFLENLLRGEKWLQRLGDVLAAAATAVSHTENGARHRQQLESILVFLSKHHHVLRCRPDLVSQCVRNSPSSFTSISRLNTRTLERLNEAITEKNASSQSLPTRDDALRRLLVETTANRTTDSRIESGAVGTIPLNKSENTSGDAQRTAAAEDGHDRYQVRWLNVDQHGCENQLLVAKPSPHAVRCVCLSDAGDVIALAHDDAFVRIANAAAVDDGVASLPHDAPVSGMSFLPHQSALLVTGDETGAVHMWDAMEGTRLRRAACHLRAVSSVACHPSQGVVCTGGLDGYCMLWDTVCITTGEDNASSSRTHSTLSSRIREALSDDGTHSRGGLRVFWTTKGEHSLKEEALSNDLLLPPFLPPTNISECTVDNSDSFLWRPFLVLRHHTSPVASVTFHPSGDVLASGAWDGRVFLFNLSHASKATSRKDPQRRHGDSTSSSRSESVTVRTDEQRFTADTAHHLFPLSCVAVGSAVRHLCFRPSMVVTCAVGTFHGHVALIDGAAGRVSARLTGLHAAPVSALSYSPDGRLMASADDAGVVRLTHAGLTGSLLCTLNGHRGAVTGALFCAARNDGTDDALAVAAGESPTFLLSAGADKSVQKWRVSQPTETSPPLPPSHIMTVTAVAVAQPTGRGPTPRMFVTGSADGIALVFAPDDFMTAMEGVDSNDIHATGRHNRGINASQAETTDALTPQFVLRHDGGRISCIAFALNNTRILVGQSAGVTCVWSAAPGVNRREGHLLFRVHVPQSGSSPVVQLTSITIGSRAAQERWRGASEREDAPTLSAGDTPDSALEERVVALCSNGETAVFFLTDRAVVGTSTRPDTVWRGELRWLLDPEDQSCRGDAPKRTRRDDGLSENNADISASPSAQEITNPPTPRSHAKEATDASTPTTRPCDEEVITAIPLGRCPGTDPATDTDAWHMSFLVCRRGLRLAAQRERYFSGCACAAIVNAPGSSTPLTAADYLEEGESIDHASRTVRWVRMSGGADGSVAVAGTSVGCILVFWVEVDGLLTCAESKADDTSTTREGGCHSSSASNRPESSTSVMNALRSSARVSLLARLSLPRLLRTASVPPERMLLSCLDAQLLFYPQPSSDLASMECGRLHIIVGGQDGSTVVLASTTAIFTGALGGENTRSSSSWTAPEFAVIGSFVAPVGLTALAVASPPLSSSGSLLWIAGDALGNVYQLLLVDAAREERDALLAVILAQPPPHSSLAAPCTGDTHWARAEGDRSWRALPPAFSRQSTSSALEFIRRFEASVPDECREKDVGDCGSLGGHAGRCGDLSSGGLMHMEPQHGSVKIDEVGRSREATEQTDAVARSLKERLQSERDRIACIFAEASGGANEKTHAVPETKTQHTSADYFSILCATDPAETLGTAKEREQWHQTQTAVLTEAQRVQDYNPDARAALQTYYAKKNVPV